MSRRAFDSDEANRDLLWIVFGEVALSVPPTWLPVDASGFWGFTAWAKAYGDEQRAVYGQSAYAARIFRPILCKTDAPWMHPDRGASLLYLWGRNTGGSFPAEIFAPTASASYDSGSGEVRVTVNLLPMPRSDLSAKWIVLQYSYRTTPGGTLQSVTSSPIYLPNMTGPTTTFVALNIGANLYTVSVGFVSA